MPRDHVPTYTPDLEPLDRDTIAHAETEHVRDTLAGKDGAPRVTAARKIADEARAQADKQTPLLERLALSAYFYEHTTGVPEAAGFTEDRWSQLRRAALGLEEDARLPLHYHVGPDSSPQAKARAERAAEAAHTAAELAGVKKVRRASARLPEVANAVAQAEARAQAAAAEARAVVEAVPEGSSSPRRRLPHLDLETLTDNAAADVARQMSPLLADPEGRFRAACKLITDARKDMNDLLKVRNELVASAYFYDHAQAAHHAAGVLPQEFLEIRRKALGLHKGAKVPRLTTSNRHEITELARTAGVKHIPDAIDRLPEAAQRYAQLRAQVQAALPFRDSAMTQLRTTLDWSRDKLADIAGIDPTQVGRLTSS